MDDTWRGEETPRLNRTNEILSRECTRIEATWTHRSFDLHLTAVLHRDRSLIGRSRSSIYLSFFGQRRRIMEELRDRGAIEPRSWSFWRGIILTGLENGRSSSRITIVARSWPDRGLIFEAKSTQQIANSGPIHRDIEAMFHAHRIAPSTLQIRAHEPLHHPRPSGQFSSLKACISLLRFSTFDRLVKKLSEFRGRS